jgi:hypothetical protein
MEFASNLLLRPGVRLRRRKIMGDAVAIVLLILSVCIAFRSGKLHSENALDYYHFWVVGQAIRTMEVSDVYSPRDRIRVGRYFLREAEGHSPERMAAAHRRAIIEPTATPFQYALFDLISSGNYEHDYSVFLAISILLYTLGVYALARLAGAAVVASAVFTAFCSLCFWPLRLDISFGNVTEIQLAFIALYFAALRLRHPVGGPALSAAMLAFSFYFKPNIVFAVALMGASWFILNDRRALLWNLVAFLAVGAIAVALPWSMFGTSCDWDSWLIYVPGMAYTRHFVKDSLPFLLFHTLNRTLHRVLTAAALMAILAVVWRGRAQFALARRFAERSLQHWRFECYLFSLGLCTYLLTDPFVHGQYLIFILPLTALMLGEALEERPISVTGWNLLGVISAGLLMISSNSLMRWHTRTDVPTHLWNYAGVALITGVGVARFIKMSRLPQSDEVAAAK